jgi:SAM-dependent methyltransferase
VKPSDAEDSVRACYSTWSETYYDDYYGEGAQYPPVHRDLVKALLEEAGAHAILDAGCGPASFLRELDLSLDLYGFDLTPEMVTEARRVLAAKGISPDHIWEGSVLEPADYFPRTGRTDPFDAAVCVGVLPHIPEETDVTVIDNLRASVREGGLAVVEARNQLFAAFTFNRYSHDFFVNDLMRMDELEPADAKTLDAVSADLQQRFRIDLPPIRRGHSGEPGYDEVLSRTHNPIVLRDQFAAAGFRDVRLHFYHFHAFPPMYAEAAGDLFRKRSLEMENTPEDWRGLFMASAFLVSGRRA